MLFTKSVDGSLAFQVVERRVTEQDASKRHSVMQTLYREVRHNPKTLAAAVAGRLSKTRFGDVSANATTVDRVRKGDFGEAIATHDVIADGYEVPVHKLRVKISGNQTLPGVDVVGFKLNEKRDRIDRAVYVESKFRNADDAQLNPLAVVAHEQLRDFCQLQMAALHGFIVEQLNEHKSDLADLHEAYLNSKDPDIDDFRLALHIPESALPATAKLTSLEMIVNLSKVSPLLSNLSVVGFLYPPSVST